VLHQNSIIFFSKPGSCLDILVDQGDNITQYVCKKNTPEFLVHIIGIFQATAKKSTFCPVFDSQNSNVHSSLIFWPNHPIFWILMV
jgi:Mor family transcriptional regulator